MKKCLYCAEQIPNNAKKCPYCGEEVEVSSKEERSHVDNDFIVKIPNKHIIEYVWCIVYNLLTLCIVIGIYDALYESFEYISMSALIIIYINIHLFIRMRCNEKAFQNSLHKKVSNKESTSPHGIDATLKRRKILFRINIGFAVLIYIIVLGNLLDNI